MNLKGKRTLVVGLGKTGEALCDFLIQAGSTLLLSEKRTQEQLGPSYEKWNNKAVLFETGGHTTNFFLNADIIITSPGVPQLKEFQSAKAAGIPVISEIELAYSYLKGKIVGITGSNGKSTTTTLTYKILKENGIQAFLAGNIGTPLIQFVKNSSEKDVYVTELSSFQLENTNRFRAFISIFLNITPDHLDWHLSFNNYFKAKTKLFLNQTEDDISILNKDDKSVWSVKNKTNASVYSFSRKQEVHPGIFIKDDMIQLGNNKNSTLMNLSEIPLLGEHNRENIMASALVGHLFKIPEKDIKNSIMTFKGLDHRLKYVFSLNGIDFFNDSKATNVDSCLKAIKSFKHKIILILGGRDKGGDFTKLKKEIQKRIKHIVVLGEAKNKIRRSLNGISPVTDTETMAQAVKSAYSIAEAGDTILLAPACTSWDMYKNFEERGEDFEWNVKTLQTKNGDVHV